MSQSTASKILLADNAGITTNAIWPSLRTIGFDGNRQYAYEHGHKGTRQHNKGRARVSSLTSGGVCEGFLTAAEIDWLLPRALGTTASSTLIPGESISAIYALVDKVAAKYLYNAQYITALEISGSQTQPINWMFECVGGAETVWSSAWPASPSTVDAGNMYMFADSAFNFASTAYSLQSWKMRIDNKVDGGQFEQALTPTRFETQDLMVTFEAMCAFRSDTLALKDSAVAGGVGTLVLADGTNTYTFTMANLKIPTEQGPKIPEQGRINMPLRMTSFWNNSTLATAANNAISVVKS